MKRSGKIIGILLMLFVAGNVSLKAQRDMRGMIDSTRMNRIRTGNDFRQNQRIGPKTDSLWIRGMRHGMGPAAMYHRGQFMDSPQMFGMRRGMGPGPGHEIMRGMRSRPGREMIRGMRPGTGFDMRRGMGMVPMDSMGWRQMGPERWMLESIPNVTEKQKKEISALRLKQQDEMKKLREEMLAKMKSLRESNRNKMLDLLTDEQKKFIESWAGNTNPAPAKAK